MLNHSPDTAVRGRMFEYAFILETDPMALRARRRAAARALIDCALQLALDRLAGQARDAFLRLIVHTQRVSTFHRSPDFSGKLSVGDTWRIIGGLRALAYFQHQWLRPVENWIPESPRLLPQFSSLAHHLLARYPVPPFMVWAWLPGTTVDALRDQQWYVHLGAGKNIRTAELPLPFTRAMAHEFGQAPADLTINQALRWAQVHGLGGSRGLARAIISTRLGSTLEHDSFWRSVVQFFVNQRSLDLNQVAPIVHFLQHQRFESREAVIDGQLLQVGPRRPDFSLKGRTLNSLLRAMKEWHKELGMETSRPAIRWAGSKIGEFRLVEGDEENRDMRLWTITELLSSHELRAEGHAMRHCVAIYDRRCAKGQSSIWAMRVEDRKGKRRVLTIEVDPKSRSICQARRSQDAFPCAKDRHVLTQWANQEGLEICC